MVKVQALLVMRALFQQLFGDRPAQTVMNVKVPGVVTEFEMCVLAGA